MTDLVLIAIAGAAIYYLGHRALITRWLWSRYPRWLDSLMGCSACLGTWIGAGTGAWMFHVEHPLLGICGWLVIPLAAAAGMVLIPIASAALLYSLIMASSDEFPHGNQSEP